MATRATLILFAALMVGCGGFKNSYVVEVRAGEGEFRARAMPVYVMICDKTYPAPTFGSAKEIDAWFKEQKVGAYTFKQMETARRAHYFTIRPQEADPPPAELDTGDLKGEDTDMKIVVVARMTKTTREHALTEPLSKKRGTYTFVLTPRKLSLLTEEEAEAPAPEKKTEPEKKDDTADKAADAAKDTAEDAGEDAAKDAVKKKVGP